MAVWGVIGRLGSWLNLSGVGEKVRNVNSGGLRSMAMANGMVHSSNSKATLAPDGLAHNLNPTAASGEKAKWGS